MKNLFLLSFLGFLLASADVPLHAQDGALDPAWDTDGIKISDFGGTDYSQDVVVQPDGKVVVVGSAEVGSETHWLVLRYLPDGTPDVTFDGDGKATLDFDALNTTEAEAEAVVLQGDGKILVAGFTSLAGDDDLALARFNADGSLDATFSGDGKLTLHQGAAGTDQRATALTQDAMGRIIVAGYTGLTPALYDFYVVRFGGSGIIDPDFGVAGEFIQDFSGDTDYLLSLLATSDGRILCGGFTYPGGGSDRDFALLLLQDDGTLAASFDGDGVATTDFGSPSDACVGLAQQTDDMIVAVGMGADIPGSHDFAVGRYTMAGVLDNTFSTDGKALVSISGGTDQETAKDVVLQPDGRIIVGGTTFNSGNGTFALVRLQTDGSLDGTWGAGGLMLTDLGSTQDDLSHMALQPDGKLVACGVANSPTDVGITRFLTGIPVGVSNPSDEAKARLFPNPASEAARLQFEVLQGGIHTIDLWDVQGRVVHEYLPSGQLNAGLQSVTLDRPSGLVAGMYLLRVEGPGLHEVVRCVWE